MPVTMAIEASDEDDAIVWRFGGLGGDRASVVVVEDLEPGLRVDDEEVAEGASDVCGSHGEGESASRLHEIGGLGGELTKLRGSDEW